MTGVEAVVSGAFLVDLMPFRMFQMKAQSSGSLTSFQVRFIPSWVPGAVFKRKALRWGQLAEDSSQLPFQETRKHVVS